MWQSAVNKEWKYILDRSATGTGKSHTVGTLQAKDFKGLEVDLEVDTIFYLASDHRNPTTKTIENNFTDLPTRHDGLAIDRSRKTPMGQPFLVRPNADSREMERTPSNCRRTHLFHELAEKNIPNIQGSESPICGGCPMSGACSHSVGDGYGFKYLRSQAMQATELRAHPDSMPIPDEYPYEKVINIWEEAETLFKATKSVEFSNSDINSGIGKLYQEGKKALLEKLEPVLKVSQEIAQSKTPPSPYGWGNADIRKMLPEVPEDIEDLISEVEKILQPDLSFLSEEPDKVVGTQANGYQKKLINSALRREALREGSKGLEAVPVSWLPDLLRVWKGDGSIRCQWGKFTITKVSDRHREIAQAAKANIFLSTTMRRKDLALHLGVDPDEILVIECDRPRFPNLKATQVSGMGHLGKARSDVLNQRLHATKEKLSIRHPGIEFIGWKGCDDSYHFRDGRGTNRYADKKALASVGVPFPDYGACKAEYEALGGDPDGLEDYYHAKVQAEIAQEVGRLRAQLRPDEELYYYFLGDYVLTFLKDLMPGITINTVDAYSITPEAGTQGQKTRQAILEAYKALTEGGVRTTQEAIAQKANITQGRVSQIAKNLGGWDFLLKVLRVLFAQNKAPNGAIPPDVDEDVLWWAKNYLPPLLEACPSVELVAEVVFFVTTYGLKAFEQAVGLAGEDIRIRLLGAIASHLIC